MQNSTRISFADILRHPASLVAVCFGAGLLPYSPGTAGAILAVPVALLLRPLGFGGEAMAFSILVVLGIWICGVASRHMEHEDHPAIVLDETLGALLVFLATPTSFISWILGLTAFRFFDIVKPWPIKIVQRDVSGGLGIVADDLAAAIPSIAVVWLFALLFKI